MPKALPPEFRRDVIAVFRSAEGATIAQIAKDLGISESWLQRWLNKGDIEAGRGPGTTASYAGELREAKKRIRLLEQENAVLRRAAMYLGRDVNPK